MAIAFVQATSVDGATSLAFASNVTAGSGLFAIIRRGGTGSQPTSLSGGGTWTKDEEVTVASDHTLGLWSCPNASSGATTVAQTGGAGSSRFVIIEVSGLATSSMLDVDNSTTGTSATPTSPSITTTVADTILISGFSTVGDVSGGGSGFTAGGSGTIASAVNKVAGQYQIVSSTGSYSASVALPGSDTWGAIIAAYKIAGGGGTFGRLVGGTLTGGLLVGGLLVGS